MRIRPVRPAAPTEGIQEYLPDTNILRTVIGDIEIIDFMPWDGTDYTPPGRVVRVVTARRGPVEVAVDVTPGAAFRPARKVHAFSTGMAFDGTVVRAGIPFDGRRATVVLEPGERFVVTVDIEANDDDPLSPGAALDLCDRTAEAWRLHLEPVVYDGPYEEAVRRSLLVIKGLTYHATGAVVAAPTTSLPEKIGGERNWDYRYAWVRDASLAVDAAYHAGLHEEVERFTSWLRLVLTDTSFPLRPLYTVDGLPLPEDETILPLAGYRRSQPVRIGNGAATHLQLDFYADLVEVLHPPAADEVWPALARMADWLADAWQQPDRGIWEIRSEPRHFVHSKVACAFALSKLTEAARRRNPLDLDAVVWWESAREVVDWVERHGLAVDGGLRQDTRPDDEADAALLTTVWRGPWPPDREVLGKTVDRVLKRLSDGAFVHRYGTTSPDGLPPGEGAFLPTSFWAVKALGLLGRWEEAHARMEELVAFAGPLGLLPEEADPRTRDFLGNVPQAFSHLTLVDAALTLATGPA